MKMVYDEATKRMVPASEIAAAAKGNYEKISLNGDLAKQLKEFAKTDGWDFSGESAVTVKDAEGKTKKDKDGNAVYEKNADGSVKTVPVTESKAKVTNAIKKYAEIAIADFIKARNSIEPEPES